MAPDLPSMAAAVIAVRCALSLVFITAAAGKLRHLATFRGVVTNYRLLPDVLVAAVSFGLPPAEALVAIALLVWVGSVVPLFAAAVLLAVFATAMAVNLRRGRRHIDCGCFQSTLKQTLRWSLVARNGALLLLAVVAGVLPAQPPTGWELLNGVLAGGAAFLVLQSMNALWAIVPAQGAAHRAAQNAGGSTSGALAGAPSH